MYIYIQIYIIYNNNANKTRKRNIIWFNPSFSMNVKNNIGKNVSQLIDKHFLCSIKLRKTFNLNTVKISYCCTPNFQQMIKIYNKKLTSRKEQKTTDCNCRRKQECPMQGKCRAEVLFTTVWQNLTTFHQKHTSEHQKTIRNTLLQPH